MPSLSANDLLTKTKHFLSIIETKHQAGEFNHRQVDELIIHILNTTLLYSIKKEASDIHFEAVKLGLRVRIRQYGVLQSILICPDYLANRIINRIKIMAKLDISQSILPQDGQITWQGKENNTAHEFRVSTCPTYLGEKCVLRLLKQQTLLSIKHLGMSENQKEQCLRILKRRQGLILITGPTGSGKTTTLYAALKELNHEGINTLSIEDPIEIKLDGINQVNINPKAGLSFASCLRAFLRQDPDVIMIGEIRDRETAEIALKAAHTGHLVIASLHANSTLGAITRLENIGIPKHSIADGLSLIIAQRMLRKVCQDCLGSTQSDQQKCSKCEQGYTGQTGIFELLEIDATLNHYIVNNTTKSEIEAYLSSKLHQNLEKEAIQKANDGLVALSEVNRLGLS
jgi:type IV pilus assembly protein PilB